MGTIERGVAIRREGELPRPGQPFEHPFGQATDDLEPRLVDVEEDELVDRKTVGASDEALDELGSVGAPAADDRDLDTHCATLPERLRAARPLAGLDTIAYNVISNPSSRKT